MEEGPQKKISDDGQVGSRTEMMMIIDANEKSWPWTLLCFFIRFGFSTRAGEKGGIGEKTLLCFFRTG